MANLSAGVGWVNSTCRNLLAAPKQTLMTFRFWPVAGGHERLLPGSEALRASTEHRPAMEKPDGPEWVGMVRSTPRRPVVESVADRMVAYSVNHEQVVLVKSAYLFGLTLAGNAKLQEFLHSRTVDTPRDK